MDAKLVSHGFRNGDGEIRNNVGVDIDKDTVRELHNLRKKAWKETANLMNKLIQKNLKNKKAELPQEIQKVKEQLKNARTILPTL